VHFEEEEEEEGGRGVAQRIGDSCQGRELSNRPALPQRMTVVGSFSWE